MKRVAIVTGASAGLGVEFAKQLDEWNNLDEIWLVARRAERLQLLAKQLKHPSVIIPADLATDAGVLEVTSRLTDVEVKLLVNNAGFGKETKYIETDERINFQMAYLNMLAPIKLIQACTPYMKQGDGIINVASTAGFIPYTHLNLYSATKAFLLHLSLGLRNELKDKGIRVLTVCPGPVRTEFFTVASEGNSKTYGADPKEVVKLALRDYFWRAISIYGIQYQIGTFIAKLLPKALVASITK